MRNRHNRTARDGQEGDVAFHFGQLPGQLDDEEFDETYRLLRRESFLEEQPMLVQPQQNEWDEAEVESEEPLNVKAERLERQDIRLTSKVRELTSQLREMEATEQERAVTIAELEERCKSYQSRLEDMERFMDRRITKRQDADHEDDRQRDRYVSGHASRLCQDLNQQDETPQTEPREWSVVSAPWGPLEIRHVLEANYNPGPIPAAVWDQLRSQMARWADLKEDWSQRPRRGKDFCAERWSSHNGTSRPSKGHACQYCERHGLVYVALGNGTVELCPVSADMDKQGPGDIGFWVRTMEDSKTETSTEANEDDPLQLPWTVDEVRRQDFADESMSVRIWDTVRELMDGFDTRNPDWTMATDRRGGPVCAQMYVSKLVTKWVDDEKSNSCQSCRRKGRRCIIVRNGRMDIGALAAES